MHVDAVSCPTDRYYQMLGASIERDRDFEDLLRHHWGFAEAGSALPLCPSTVWAYITISPYITLLSLCTLLGPAAFGRHAWQVRDGECLMRRMEGSLSAMLRGRAGIRFSEAPGVRASPYSNNKFISCEPVDAQDWRSGIVDGSLTAGRRPQLSFLLDAVDAVTNRGLMPSGSDSQRAGAMTLGCQIHMSEVCSTALLTCCASSRAWEVALRHHCRPRLKSEAVRRRFATVESWLL